MYGIAHRNQIDIFIFTAGENPLNPILPGKPPHFPFTFHLIFKAASVPQLKRAFFIHVVLVSSAYKVSLCFPPTQ